MVPDLTAISQTLTFGILGATYQCMLPSYQDSELEWMILSGVLPYGLTLKQGIITGTPTQAGTFKFTVRVSKASEFSLADFYIVIHEPPEIIASIDVMPLVGEDVHIELFACVTDIVKWGLHDGTLPPGLDLCDGGVLAGVPTTEGKYHFDVVACAGEVNYIRSFDMTILSDEDPGDIIPKRPPAFPRLINRFMRLIEKDADFFSYYNVDPEEAFELAKEQARGYIFDAIDLLHSMCQPQVDFYDYDEDEGDFGFEITNREAGLLALLMRQVFYERDYALLGAFKIALTPKDLNYFSPANERRTFVNMLNQIRRDNRMRISQYVSVDRLTGGPVFIDYAAERV